VIWVISVYFNIRNTLQKFGTFLLGHLVYYEILNEFQNLQQPKEWKEDKTFGNLNCGCYSVISPKTVPRELKE
jgi:hypothetical protein